MNIITMSLAKRLAIILSVFLVTGCAGCYACFIVAEVEMILLIDARAFDQSVTGGHSLQGAMSGHWRILLPEAGVVPARTPRLKAHEMVGTCVPERNELA